MISVIIPTYKNIELLIDNLNKNLPFLGDCEIIVVNDDPERSVLADLKEFPKVKLIENKLNLGFAPSMNAGVANSTGDYLLFLNNDVVLKDATYLSAEKYLQDNQKVFAVTFAQVEKDNTIVGKNRIYWENGFFQHGRASSLGGGITAWAECGSCMVDRKKFLEIGGFDESYAPFYWEDVDLSYRAYKRGYEVYYDPLIVVAHEHETTTSKFYSPDQIKTIALRNQLIFIWKNIKDGGLVWDHRMKLLRLLVTSVVKGDINVIIAFVMALRSMQAAAKKNAGKDTPVKITDTSLINKLKTV